MTIHRQKTHLRALRLFATWALTLIFLAAAGVAEAAPEFDEAFFGYVTRMILALVVLGLLGYAAVKFLPGRFISPSRGHLKVIGAISLGREMIYIVKTGPDVVAFLSGRGGATVLGRWGAEEWDGYEAAQNVSAVGAADEKRQ
jgi:hypothetical protein